MSKITYLGYYDIAGSDNQNRNITPAATNKMTYICSAMNQSDHDIEIISASGSLNRSYYPGCIKIVLPRTVLRLFPTCGHGGSLRRVISRWWTFLNMFTYLFLHVKRGQNVIIYHSLGYMEWVKLLKKLKKFYLILEVEEIYGDVTGSSKTVHQEKAFFNIADAYIFPTQLLDQNINTKNKPSVIIYGTYQVESPRKECFNDNKIHVVYAGTLDPRKGGAIATATASAFLTDKFHIHILGFGSQHDIHEMKELVKNYSIPGHATLTYDGVLFGEDYIKFIQKCHIGMSTQNPDATFNASSFPSKVLSYLANGLHVVSIRIPAIEYSAVGDMLDYYDIQTPEAIAQAIINVDVTTAYNSRNRIEELSKQFVQSLDKLLK